MSFQQPQPFTINISDSLLKLTREKLLEARFPDQLQDVTWEDGTPVDEVKRLVDHWLNKYDWRVHEAELNTLTQFTLPIRVEGFDTLEIHFVHQPSSRKYAIPLIFIHGWPGHFNEVSKILEPLTNPPEGTQAFHVVAPSIPGFAFSSNPTKKGFSISKIAETFNQLMLSLGYNEYVAQGGDWGSSISRVLGVVFPQNCKGVHVNLLKGVGPPRWYRNPWVWIKMHSQLVHYSREEENMMARSRWFDKEESGYRLIQMTKPQSLSYGLWDSPVGLLAWIREKLHTWTDNYPWTDDEIITWVMIYWVTVVTGGLRIYKEATDIDFARTAYVPVPFGISVFPKDLYGIPRDWASTLGKLRFWKMHQSGGHFAAWERPDELVSDIREFYGPGGGAAGVVKK